MTLAKASVLANPSVSDSDFLTVTHTRRIRTHPHMHRAPCRMSSAPHRVTSNRLHKAQRELIGTELDPSTR